MKKYILSIAIFALVVFLVGCGNNNLVFYYGNGCPHCENVEKYMSDNSIESKVNIVKKEVWSNEQDQAEMVSRATKCGVKTGQIGVPMLWDGNKCYVGDADIINYFKTNIK